MVHIPLVQDPDKGTNMIQKVDDKNHFGPIELLNDFFQSSQEVDNGRFGKSQKKK